MVHVRTARYSPRTPIRGVLTRSQIVGRPVEAAPLSIIGARVEAAVRVARKGEPRETVETAVRRAQGDAALLSCLVVTLNGRALEVARVEGLRAAATFFWMGALLGGPYGGPEAASSAPDPNASAQGGAWLLWRSVVDRLSTDVQVEAEARASLERRYLAGHDLLFTDAATAWAEHVDLVERLAGLAEVIGSDEPPRTARGKPGRSGTRDSFGAQVEALASRLADDARMKAYEIVGDRERAVSIMEGRLRESPTDAGDP